MKKTVLVTGSSGFIGSAFVRSVQDKYRIIGVDLVCCGLPDTPCFTQLTADICDSNRMEEILRQFSVDVIVHTAAEKSLAACQREPEQAYAVNYLATEHLHKLAARYHSKFIYISSDQVFNGAEGRYTEDAVVSAINYYGKLKIKVEQLLKEDPRAAICRTALVFGNIPAEQRAYFDQVKRSGTLAVQGYIVQQTAYCLQNGIPLLLPDDEYVSPTHAHLLARQLDTVIERDISGILHCCGKERISRYEMGLAIARHYGLSSDALLSCGQQDPLRPKDVSLDCAKTEKLLGFSFLTFQEALLQYMRED